MTDELSALVAGVLADLDGAGALADFLAEQGREKEAVLLRRRWKTWLRLRGEARVHDATWEDARPVLGDRWADATVNCADDLFRAYICGRFAGVRIEDVPYWISDHLGIGHAVVSTVGSHFYPVCRRFFLTDKRNLITTRPRRICSDCRAQLPHAKEAA